MSWLDSYGSQIVTAEEAVEVIKQNDRVYILYVMRAERQLRKYLREERDQK